MHEHIKWVTESPDIELINKIPDLRQEAQAALVPFLIERWFEAKSADLQDQLYQYFLDAKKQEELVFYMDAIRNEKYYGRQSELVAVLWQSSLDSSEHFNELIEIALEGDYMTIIEVGTVIDSYDHAFEEDLVLDAQFRLEEAIEEEDDEDRKKLLVNLKQIISGLHLING